MNDYQTLWNDTLDKLSHNLSDRSFEETFGDVKHVVKEENGLIYVLAPNTFKKSKIINIYSKQISEILGTLTNDKLKFKFVTKEELEVTKPTPHTFTKFSKHNLNENYTFESFIVGDSNRLAYISAMKVADNPGIAANPLYIFGSVGLGKTHLMQAIGNYISESDLNNKILYVQANEYLEDYVKATRDKKMQAFEEKYEDLDVLLVDDIQMLEKGKNSQDEFFKLFNNMVNRQKQIVITSDCPASKLNGIMERLTDRFKSGMTVDIKQPELNQRINILKRKLAETTEITIDEDVIHYIAENITNNVRELEGALTRVLWVAEVYGSKPTLAIAIDALDILLKAKKPNNNYEDALSVIANMYGISVVDLLGNCRNAKYVLPRHIAMYILNTHYNLNYSQIGSIMNGKNHTTVINGCDKIKNEIKTNKQLEMAIDSILKKV